jgi:riboflavin biosynthesis pyrimidine reductase
MTLVPTATTAMTDAATPLHLLFERTDGDTGDVRGSDMPAALAARYGGQLLVPLHDDRPTVIANFVTTLDGIVAFGHGALSGGGLISGFHEPDRFVMGLLRSLADVVLVGAGTLRGSTDHRWTPDHVHRASAPAFAAWRTAMGLAPQPTTMIATASGDIPTNHAGLSDPRVPVVIATTASGAARIRRSGVADHVVVRAVSDRAALSVDDLGRLAAELDARLVLTEGGPHLLGEFIDADMLDELFLTLAPQLVGRGDANRLGLVEGTALPPDATSWRSLSSVRRSDDHIFLRYGRRGDASRARGTSR